MSDKLRQPVSAGEPSIGHELILGHEFFEAFDCASGRRITDELVAVGHPLAEAPMLSVLFPEWRNKQRRFVSTGTLTVAGLLAEGRLRAKASEPLVDAVLGAWESIIAGTESPIVLQTPELAAVGVLRLVAAFHPPDDSRGTLALVRLINLLLRDKLLFDLALVNDVQAAARSFLQSIEYSRDKDGGVGASTIGFASTDEKGRKPSGDSQNVHVDPSAVMTDTQREGPSRLPSEPEGSDMKPDESDAILLFDTVKSFREIRDRYRLSKLATALSLDIPLRLELNIRDVEKLINKLGGKSFGSLEANQIAAQEIQAFLNDSGFRIACPKPGCKIAAALHCTTGTRKKNGMFVFVHSGAKGQAHHGGYVTLPKKMFLLPAPARSKRSRLPNTK